VKIKYTRHAEKKFADLRIFGIFVTKSKISDTIKKPKYRSLDNGNSIIAAGFDKRHNLRVVYKQQRGDIIVITFYIYRKGRYGEN